MPRTADRLGMPTRCPRRWARASRQGGGSTPMSGGLHFRSVHGIADARTMVQVLDAVWGGWADAAGIQDATILALAHAGNYAEVALLGVEPVGAALGFFGEPL